MKDLLNTQLHRILEKHQHLHFNVPYDDAEAERRDHFDSGLKF